MKVGDYFDDGRRPWFRFHEKGSKRHEVPVHHNALEYMDAYIEAAKLKECDPKGPIFRTVNRKRQLTDWPMSRVEVFLMIKRRARAASLPPSTCCHTFRATGITAYLSNGGTLENAQAIAAHESPRTTMLYDRTNDEITLDEVEKIRI
jgi:integrase/recombinase XerD